MLIGLAFHLTTPDIGSPQDTGLTGSADRPLSNAMSSISGFSWNGIWARSGGEWAWRPNVNYGWFQPNVNYVWQSGFGCPGYGSPGFGWGSYSHWIWPPDRYTPHRRGGAWGRWELVPGGWMWFPDQRFNNAGNLWYLEPRVGFGGQTGCYDAFGPQFRRNRESAFSRSPFALAGAGEARQNPSGRTPPTDAPGRDRARALIDPVRGVPVVTLTVEGKDGNPSGRTLRDRPLIDPVRPTRPVEVRPKTVGREFQRTPEKTPFRPKGMLSESRPDRRRLTTPLLNWKRTAIGVSPTSRPKSVNPRAGNPVLVRPQRSGRSSSAGKAKAAPEQ